ncbi:hypothetical protein F5Y15DRAFT_308241 [Xylariaceae sp. FL0016]|nr:hypothetical protein F5Y15DRAFT_308241 [Xylariaceae sp. FL0016]
MIMKRLLAADRHVANMCSNIYRWSRQRAPTDGGYHGRKSRAIATSTERNSKVSSLKTFFNTQLRISAPIRRFRVLSLILHHQNQVRGKQTAGKHCPRYMDDPPHPGDASIPRHLSHMLGARHGRFRSFLNTHRSSHQTEKCYGVGASRPTAFSLFHFGPPTAYPRYSWMFRLLLRSLSSGMTVVILAVGEWCINACLSRVPGKLY